MIWECLVLFQVRYASVASKPIPKSLALDMFEEVFRLPFSQTFGLTSWQIVPTPDCEFL